MAAILPSIVTCVSSLSVSSVRLPFSSAASTPTTPPTAAVFPFPFVTDPFSSETFTVYRFGSAFCAAFIFLVRTTETFFRFPSLRPARIPTPSSFGKLCALAISTPISNFGSCSVTSSTLPEISMKSPRYLAFRSFSTVFPALIFSASFASITEVSPRLRLEITVLLPFPLRV